VHREFRAALPKARGDAQFIIAAFIDIRGFSPFNERVESVESGLFIRKVYQRILDDFFPSADYWKPTGDGLMLIFLFQEGTLQDRLTDVVGSSLRLVAEFKTVLTNDPVVNFAVPDKVGIGITRGAACRLVSDDKTLDYSGRILNLASRLLDLARPEGLVLDAGIGMSLLPAEIQAKFAEEKVYVRGISPREATTIYYTKGWTVISAVNKRPVDEPDWETVEENMTLKELTRYLPVFRQPLPSVPLDPTKIVIEVWAPDVLPSGKRDPTLWQTRRVTDFSYHHDQAEPLHVRYGQVIERLKKAGVRGAWPVTVKIRYAK